MPKLLDLFCGAGGAAVGYHRAGFEVVGVDIKPQPNYPFEFVRADANLFPLDGFDAFHASPPCQDHSKASNATKRTHGTAWMLINVINRFAGLDSPWVIENVPGAKKYMPDAIVMCGSGLGLETLRHRLFLSNLDLKPSICDHSLRDLWIEVSGHSMQGHEYRRRKALGLPLDTIEDRRRALGIDWMNRNELSQSIPPAYTEWLGKQILHSL